MKKIVFSFALLAAMFSTYAQNTHVSKRSSDKQTSAAQENEFSATEMAVLERSVEFTDIPEMPKSTWAVITDAEGEIIKQSRISPDNNKVNIYGMAKGMYFVSLVYKNRTMKAFVLQIEQ